MKESVKILVIDEDPEQEQLVSAALGENFNITYVANIKDARRILSKMKFDLVIVDVVLSDALGFDPCDSLNLVKPFSPIELEARIHSKLMKQKAA